MAAAGNDDAFATLYQRHHQSVYRYCLSLLRHEADARDALQSSMLAALSSLRSRPIEGAFKPWLFRIAHNQSISIIRAHGREAPTDAPPPAAFTDDPETREELRTLVSDLTALPDRQRGAIVMREMSGLSYAEIAAALGTSEAGGKQLVYEARSALQELRDGHEMSCELVRERISADDRRLLRGRKVRSHLRGCQPCRDYEEAIRRRRTAFALLAPPLSPIFAAAVLQEVFAGGGASGGAGGGGAAVGASGAASGGASVAAPAALKFVAAALVAGAAGFGAYEGASAIFAEPAASTPAAANASPDTSAGPAGGHEARDVPGHAAKTASGRDGGAGAAPGAAANGRAKPGGPGAAVGEQPSAPGNPAAPGASGGSDGAATGPSSPGGGAGGGSGGGGAVDPPSPPSPPPGPGPSPGGGGSTPAPGTPAGHGGTPPGQGGTPPGQAGGSVPPGHINNPGNGGGRP